MIYKLVFKKGRGLKNTGLVRILDKTYGKFRGIHKGSKRRKYEAWYDKRPEGTEEELLESWKVAEEYLYKILDYAEKGEEIPKEELAELRRIFAFAKQGPRAHHHVVHNRSKLVSADVLYFLTSSLPSQKLADMYGLAAKNEIDIIRRGENATWEWEYRLIKRLKAIVKGHLQQSRSVFVGKVIFVLKHIESINSERILCYTTSNRKAKAIRESIIPKIEYNKLLKEGTLDIIYPIDMIEVLS